MKRPSARILTSAVSHAANGAGNAALSVIGKRQSIRNQFVGVSMLRDVTPPYKRILMFAGAAAALMSVSATALLVYELANLPRETRRNRAERRRLTHDIREAVIDAYDPSNAAAFHKERPTADLSLGPDRRPVPVCLELR